MRTFKTFKTIVPAAAGGRDVRLLPPGVVAATLVTFRRVAFAPVAFMQV